MKVEWATAAAVGTWPDKDQGLFDPDPEVQALNWALLEKHHKESKFLPKNRQEYTEWWSWRKQRTVLDQFKGEPQDVMRDKTKTALAGYLGLPVEGWGNRLTVGSKYIEVQYRMANTTMPYLRVPRRPEAPAYALVVPTAKGLCENPLTVTELTLVGWIDKEGYTNNGKDIKGKFSLQADHLRTPQELKDRIYKEER
jgi:hypothetical protein